MFFIVGLGFIFLHAGDQAPDCFDQICQHVHTKELLAKATKRVEPSIPPGFGRIDSEVPVTISIGPKGTVTCASAAEKAHPILRKICEEAALQWLFKPFLNKEQPIVVTGKIVFHIKH